MARGRFSSGTGTPSPRPSRTTGRSGKGCCTGGNRRATSKRGSAIRSSARTRHRSGRSRQSRPRLSRTPSSLSPHAPRETCTASSSATTSTASTVATASSCGLCPCARPSRSTTPRRYPGTSVWCSGGRAPSGRSCGTRSRQAPWGCSSSAPITSESTTRSSSCTRETHTTTTRGPREKSWMFSNPGSRPGTLSASTRSSSRRGRTSACASFLGLLGRRPTGCWGAASCTSSPLLTPT
mmetsp:Transcript_11476/g.27794  ORF Transcript_11476/g.27794 Transcript_11476/m.27794 type:complete len:238 (+) Transcript_11476:262-975(+)